MSQDQTKSSESGASAPDAEDATPVVLFAGEDPAIQTISLLCPTRERPHGVLRLVRSVVALADRPEAVEFVFYVDADDESFPSHADFRQMMTELRSKDEREGRSRDLRLNCRLIKANPSAPKLILAQAWNACAEVATGDILMLTADDIEFKSRGWDTMVRDAFAQWPDGIGLVHGDEGSGWQGITASLPFVSRKWTDVVGYFVPPHFSAGWVDQWLQELADRVFRRHYLPELLIEHHHAVYGKAEWDANYIEAQRRIQQDQVDLLYTRTQNERWDAAMKLWRATHPASGASKENSRSVDV